MLNEITVSQARAIIDATEKLARARNTLALLSNPTRVSINVEWRSGIGWDEKKGTVQHVGDCQHSQISRSTADAVRKHWQRVEADAIRTLRQLGAEVPNG